MTDRAQLGGQRPKVVASDALSRTLRLGAASIHHGDVSAVYDEWRPPACIISDGPYGLGKFPGEASNPDKLAEWYAPHAAAWARSSLPYTTLWFWNSEIGWAKANEALEKVAKGVRAKKAKAAAEGGVKTNNTAASSSSSSIVSKL